AAAAEGKEAGSIEVDVLSRRCRGEGVDRQRCAEGIGHVVEFGGRGCDAPYRRNVRKAEEGSLPVELQVIFALEDVVEDAEAAANGGLAAAAGVIGEAEARGPVVLVGEVRTLGSAAIAGEHQPDRSVDEALRDLTRSDGER